MADAFICIVPRTITIAYELYRHLKIEDPEVWRVAVTAVVMTVIHTVLLRFLYGPRRRSLCRGPWIPS